MADTFRTERTAVMATAMQQSQAWPVVFKAGSALTLAEAVYDAVAPDRFAERQTELLQANNRYLDRYRASDGRRHEAADRLEFAAKHYIAEDDLADALNTLSALREEIRDIAIELRGGEMRAVPPATIRSIPIAAAQGIAKEYGYDQVIIIARRCHDTPEPHGEHVTTYGRTVDHCAVAADIGDFLKFKVMGWVEEESHG